MSLAETEGILTTEKEKTEKENRVVINVPVSCVISVPIEIEFDSGKLELEESEELGCYVANPLDNQEAAEKAVSAATQSHVASKAFDGLTSAAMRFKEVFPDVDIYVTPFAGMVKEHKL